MDGLLKTVQDIENEDDFSLKKFFVPLTTAKAITWIVVIGLVVYFNSLFNGFVLDDFQQVVDNINVHTIANFPSFFLGSTFYNGGAVNLSGAYYKPLLSLFYSIIYSFFGPNPFVFHFFQLLLHIINTCILFLFLKIFFKRSIAFFLSLVFLVHPINSETVFYIADAQDILFFFFGIFGLYIYATTKSLSKLPLIMVLVCLLFSILSKETGILFFITLLVYSYIYKYKYFLKFLVASIAVFVCYFFLRVSAIGMTPTPVIAPIYKLNLSERMINMPSIFLFYLKQFILPINLSSSYQWAYQQVTIKTFFLPLLIDLVVLAAFSLIVFILYKKKLHTPFKAYLFFYLWFLIGMIFHLQFFPLDATVAERWFYFPLVGLFGMLGIILTVIPSNRYKTIMLTFAVCLVFILSVRTFIRSFNWRDQFTLVAHDSNVSKDNYVLDKVLSYELTKQGKFTVAKVYAEKSIVDYPTYGGYINLGIANFNLGDYQGAKAAYMQSLKYGSGYEGYADLATLTLVNGDPKENIPNVKDILKKYPSIGSIWCILAILEYRSNDISGAQYAINKAYSYSQTPFILATYNSIMNNEAITISGQSIKTGSKIFHLD